jgi:phenylalanyl-tRNA synthetase beta chain
MKISLNWLKDYINLEENVQQIADVLTSVGLEVEGIEEFGGEPENLKGLIVGEVLECSPHPNAEKLQVCQISTGKSGPREIICGAPNIEPGQKVVVALPGVLIHPFGNEPFMIKKTMIRGNESDGMICSEAEIGIGEKHEGIMILDPKIPVGVEFSKVHKPYVDTVFEIGLTPNRGDAASHYGVARDLKAYYKIDLSEPELLNVEVKIASDFKVKVDDHERCPRYAGILLGNLKVGESPGWLKERLNAIGQTSINSVVDITNYIMHDLGQPLHAFDLEKIKGEEIIVRTASKGEKLITLDEVERELRPEDLVICDSQKAMCFGGVFGGIDSGVGENTTSIFLESACFNPVSIRKTSLVHQLKTDAAYRFERGTDPDGVIEALLKSVKLFQDIHGAEVLSSVFDVYPEEVVPRKIKVVKEKFWTNIGHRIEEKEVEEILTGLDIELEENNPEYWIFKVPNYRTEVSEDSDIYEEFLRIFGFNSIPIRENIGSAFFSSFPEHTIEEFQQNSVRFFSDRGFWEVMNNSISNHKDQSEVDADFDRIGIPLLNPLSSDLGHLRVSLLPGLLAVLNHNLNRKAENLRLVERGKAYFKDRTGYREEEKLALVMEGKNENESWVMNSEVLGFNDIFQVTHDFLVSMGIEKIRTEKGDLPFLENGGQELIFAEKKIGKLGLVSKRICGLWDIKSQVWYCELELPDLMTLNSGFEIKFSELSKYPLVRRDLSLVLDENIDFESVKELGEKRLGPFLKMINCFSIFKGKPLEPNQKSYAISLFFERKDRTFRDKEIDEMMEALIKDFETELKAVIRR